MHTIFPWYVDSHLVSSLVGVMGFVIITGVAGDTYRSLCSAVCRIRLPRLRLRKLSIRRH